MLESVPSHQLADIRAAIVKASYKEKLDILNAVDLRERFERALPLLIRQIEGLKLLQERPDEKQILLPKTLNSRKIKTTSLDDNDDIDEIMDLEVQLSQAELPDKVKNVALKELKRIKKMSPQMPEYPMLRHYLELITDLPWNKSSKEVIDIRRARDDLDEDHYAMESVKKRILEYLAVRQLKNSLRGPILCFVGPPGVGKTSIGKSIANTLGRQFHR
jgi:ATP-dependent Lon protease